MSRPLLMLPLAAVLLPFTTVAVVADSFAPPVAYPAERYESGWQMNPFTLKTAPVAVQKESFAKDLVLGGMYGPVEKPIVRVVNTKTRESTKLSPGETDKNGMLLKKVFPAASRKDIYAEVVLNGETAVLRYDNAFIAQMATSGAPAPGQTPTAGVQGQVSPGMPANVVAMNNKPGAGTLNLTRPPASVSGAGTTTVRPPGAYTPNPYAATATAPAPQVNAAPTAVNSASNVPTPMRRRLLTAPVAPQGAKPTR